MNAQEGISGLRQLGPDVGEPEDAQSVPYVHPDLEREVMKAISRYPASRLNPDGTVHGLAAAAAILCVEKWLTDRGWSLLPPGSVVLSYGPIGPDTMDYSNAFEDEEDP